MPHIEKIVNGSFDTGQFTPWEIQAGFAVTFAASYSTTLRANVGAGSLDPVAVQTQAGSPVGDPMIVDSRLDLKGDLLKYVDYPALLNADHQDNFSIEFQFTPNYNPKPNFLMTMFSIGEVSGSLNNRIEIKHSDSGGGAIQVFISDSTGSPIVSETLANFNATNGQEYQFSLNIAIASGETRLFIDGTQHGITMTDTGFRTADINLLRVGSDILGADVSNYELRNFVIYNTVQRTVDYTITPLQVPRITTYQERGYEPPEPLESSFLVGLQAEAENGVLIQTGTIAPEEIGLSYIASAFLGRLEETDQPIVTISFIDANLVDLTTFQFEFAGTVGATKLVESTFQAVVPDNAAFFVFKLSLETNPTTAPSSVAADNLSLEFINDLVKFTDTYATLQEVDDALFNNKRWDSFGLEDKEQFIIAATTTIDNQGNWAGAKVDELQALNFPRVFTGDIQPFFNSAIQEERLKFAVCRQVEFLLQNTELGVADDSRNLRINVINELSPWAHQYVRDYQSRWA
jgi:hypothetical protein